MKVSWSEPGVVVSAVAHAALLVSMLVAFSNANRFDDAQETIPIETVSEAQFNEVMKGDKTAKEVKALPVADKIAEAEVHKPTPPTPEAKVDVPAPPPPLKHIADPGEDDQPEAKPPPAPAPPTPPVKPPEPVKAAAAPTPPTPPPPTPAPPAPATPKVQPPPLPPQKPNAETADTPAADEPKKAAEAKPVPTPPTRPPAPEKKDEAKPKPDTKPQLDQVAKLLEEKRLEELAATPDTKPVKPAPKPPSKPKSGDDQAKPTRKFDSKQIEQLLSHEDPQATGSTGRQLNKVASLGAPTATSVKMTPNILMQLEGILQDQYKQCWSYLSLGNEQKYYPLVQVTYNADGSLGTEPSLVNPPQDPSMRNLADSAVRAVKKCNPLRIPPAFAPYFDQWRKEPRILRFDPEEMSG